MDSPKSTLNDDIKPDIYEKDSDVVQFAEFASVCSFICCFGEQLGVFLTIPRICDILSCKTPSDTEVLGTLVVKLLNKARFWTRSDRWQSSLCRIIRTLAYNDPQLMAVSESLTLQQHHETVGASKSKSSASVTEDSSLPLVPLNLRVKLFLFLLESQFERNSSFKEKIKAISPQTLRLQCIGCDVWGNSYWLFVDAEYNFLFYREPPTDGLLEFIANCPATLQQFLDELSQKHIQNKSFSDLYAEYDAERLAKLNSSLDVKPPPPSSSAEIMSDPVSALSTEKPVHLKKESPDPVPTKDAGKLDPSNPPSPAGGSDPPPSSPSPLPHSQPASQPQDVAGASKQMEAEDHAVILQTKSPNGGLPSEAIPSATNDAGAPSTVTPSNCNSTTDTPVNKTCESLEPSEAPGPVKASHKSKGKSKAGGNAGAQPTRRSGRQRKPVEFLTMEAFNTPKNSKKKAIAEKTAAATELNNKKHGAAAAKKKKSKSSAAVAVENGIARPKSSKKRKHRHLRGVGKKKSKRRKGSQPWMCSPSQSEDEDFQEEEEELEFEEEEEEEDDCLPSSPSSRAKDWLDEVESDFDINACAEEDSSMTVKVGRNMERQKRRSSTAAAAAAAAAAEAAASELCDDTPCQICAKSGSPEWLLLCDQCDLGYHAMCLRPELHFIPEGDWFCPRCLHARLLTDVAARLAELRVSKAKLEASSRMQERLNFVNVSVNNIINEDNRWAKAAARQSAHWRLDSSGEEEEDGSRSSSEASSFSKEESDGVGGRRQRARRNLHHRRPTNNSRAKHRRVFSDSGASSDSASYSSTSSSSSSEDRPPPVRETRHVTAQYDVNAAFKQLDVLLDADEKYASVKQARKQRKSHLSTTNSDGEVQEVGSAGSGEDPCPISRRRKARVISDSSSDSSEESGSGDGARRRRRRHSGSEDFRPDEQEEEEEEEDEESNFSCSADGTVSSGTLSSDTWLSSRRARRKNTKRNRSSRKRSRRPVPRFEEDSAGSDDEIKPTRRRAARRINYKEFESEESAEEEEEEPAADAVEKSTVFEDSSARTPPPTQSPVGGRARRIISDSEYEPSIADDEEDELEKEKAHEDKSEQQVQPLLETNNTGEPSPASSQRELFPCDENSCQGACDCDGNAPDPSPRPGKTSPLLVSSSSPVFGESEPSQRLQAPLGSPQF